MPVGYGPGDLIVRPKQYEFRTATKPCEICGKALKLVNTRDLERKRFCSFECKTAAQVGAPSHRNHIINEVRICQSCGVSFVAKINKHRHCSDICRIKAYNPVYRKNNEGRDYHIKQLLKYKGRKSLTLEYIMQLYEQQQGLCALTGIPMTWAIGDGRVDTNLSIDRISSKKGYEHGNIQLVCRIANIMKNNLNQDYFVSLCQKICEVHSDA